MQHWPGAHAVLATVAVWGVAAAVSTPAAVRAEEGQRLYLLATGAKDDALALEDELGYFRKEVTGSTTLFFAADKDVDAVIATCRESIGLGAVEERECRLRAARRVMVDHVLEVTAVDLGKRGWEVWLRVMDADGNLRFEDLQEAPYSDLRAAAKEALPVLARRYLCTVHRVATACDTASSPGKAGGNGARGGRLEVMDVSPSPLSVWIDGQKVGLAPGQFRDLPLGEVEVAFRADGYQVATRRVTLAEQMVSLSGVRLEALPGRLVVWCNVEGAEVRVDGVALATTVGDGEVTLELPAGEVKVVATRPGYRSARHRVFVAPGAAARIEAQLEPGHDVPPGYVRIEPGTFTMGSPDSEAGRGSDEEERTVTLTRVYVLKTTEVTQGEWEVVMGNSPSFFPDCGADCPVDRVSFYDAVSYCNALSRQEGFDLCYDLSSCRGTPGTEDYACGDDLRAAANCQGYRLPTEAEWEFAARAGTTGAAYGSLADIAWYYDEASAGAAPHPVKTKAANAWGLYDMLGNVWEWTEDWNGPYLDAALDPRGAGRGSARVSRGGSWSGLAHHARAANRRDTDPASRNYDLGFRPARTVD